MEEVRWGITGSLDVAERKGGPALYNVAGYRLVAVTSRREEGKLILESTSNVSASGLCRLQADASEKAGG